MENDNTCLLAWAAGFIDADGCIDAQIVPRDDYKLRFQVRVTLTVFQSTKRHHLILRMRRLLGKGSVRRRGDGMSELCITGHKQLREALTSLLPFLWLKRAQARLVLQIIDTLPYTKDVGILLKSCALADRVGMLTDGKRRMIDCDHVRQSLRSLGHDV